MNTVKEKRTVNGLRNHDDVASRAQAIFRSACENADSYHALRLGLARRKALNAGSTRSATRLWAPLAGVAVACCALVAGVVLMRPISRTATPATVASSTPIAAEPVEAADELPEVGSTQMEMVQDLDFYRWLAAQPSVATANPRSNR